MEELLSWYLLALKLNLGFIFVCFIYDYVRHDIVYKLEDAPSILIIFLVPLFGVVSCSLYLLEEAGVIE